MVIGNVGFGKDEMCSYKHTHNGAVHTDGTGGPGGVPGGSGGDGGSGGGSSFGGGSSSGSSSGGGGGSRSGGGGSTLGTSFSSMTGAGRPMSMSDWVDKMDNPSYVAILMNKNPALAKLLIAKKNGQIRAAAKRNAHTEAASITTPFRNLSISKPSGALLASNSSNLSGLGNVYANNLDNGVQALDMALGGDDDDDDETTSSAKQKAGATIAIPSLSVLDVLTKFTKTIFKRIPIISLVSLVHETSKITPENTSTNQLQKMVEKGKAPKQIIRFDKGNPNHNESDHVHFKGGSALNKNGTWKHGSTKIDARTWMFLIKNGWKVPK